MISTYLICQRRFQLRYIERLEWPAGGIELGSEKAKDLGERFHQMANRFFLDIPVDIDKREEPTMEAWWNRFLDWSASLPIGRRLPELTITVPLANHYLTGRLDLLIIGDEGAMIFDWKTEGRIPDKAHLAGQLQTRLYLALIVEGGSGFGQQLTAEEVTFSYWYPADPPVQIRLDYSREKHQEVWTIFQDIAAGLDWLAANQATWPLTVNLGHCRNCPYQTICGREAPYKEVSDWDSSDEPIDLEPDWF